MDSLDTLDLDEPINKITMEIGNTKDGVTLRGFAKKKIKKSEITMEVGGWVQVSLGFFLIFQK